MEEQDDDSSCQQGECTEEVRASSAWLASASGLVLGRQPVAESAGRDADALQVPVVDNKQVIVRPHTEGTVAEIRSGPSCLVDARGTGGRSFPAKIKSARAQVGNSRQGNSLKCVVSDLPEPIKCEAGAESFRIRNIAEVFEQVFNVRMLRSLSVASFCRTLQDLPKCSLQVGITLAQLLLVHPRDGKFILDFVRQTWTKDTDPPCRRDLLPFEYCPPVGAVFKLLSLFPSTSSGVIVVDKSQLRKVPRQQGSKLIFEGTKQLWRWLVMTVLNGEYLDWTISRELMPAHPSLAQTAAMEMIGEHVIQFCGNPLEPWELPVYHDLVGSRTVDYGGEEVTHALPLRLEELLPGLPDAAVGGSLNALDVVDETVKAWLVDPGRTYKSRDLWPRKVPTAKINATRAEWNRLVKVLYERNILETIDKADIFSVDGELVLNGAFAVEKNGQPAPGEKKVTRFIMNMTPANAYQVLMRGDLQTLSSSTNWGSIVLPKGHCLLWSSDDQKGAFYAWRLPPCWRGLMTFRWPVPGVLLGLAVDWTYVCSAVIPMGWINAVSLFQHLHRRLGMTAPPSGSWVS